MLLFALACKDPPPPDGTPERAVILVMDGVSGLDLFQEGKSRLNGLPISWLMPELRDELLPVATRVELARNSADTRTGPAHWDLIAGRHAGLGQFGVGSGPGVYLSAWPTLFDAAHAAGVPPEETWLISNGKIAAQCERSLAPGSLVVENRPVNTNETDGDLWAAVLRTLKNERPRVIVANAHRLDTAGHYDDPDAFRASLTEADEGILAIWRYINSDPEYAGHTLLAVVSDHGRHLDGIEEGFVSHGDGCSGCRTVPMILAGPGVPDGITLADTWDLIDVAPTFAHLLGWSMPYAEGLHIVAGGTNRSGSLDVAPGTSSDTSVWVELREDPAVRAELWSAAGRMSAEGVREARGPVQVTGPAGTLLCWREIREQGEMTPWEPRCKLDRGAGWEDVGFPAEVVYPYWKPSILADGDGFLVLWADNPSGSSDPLPETNTRLHRWADNSWSEVLAPATEVYPAGPTLARRGDRLVAAWVSSPNQEQGRYNRSIRVRTAQDGLWLDDQYIEPKVLNLGRFDAPTLRTDGRAMGLRVTDLDGQTSIRAMLADDDGAGWGGLAPVSEGPVLPQIDPVWWRDQLLWAEEGGQVCAGTVGQAPRCTDAGSTLLQQVFVEDGAVGVVRQVDGRWERASLSW